METKFENQSEKTYDLNDTSSNMNMYENTCKKVRMAYTTAFSNLYIDRKKFEKILSSYEVPEFQEDIKNADEIRTYLSSYQISDMLNWLRFHKRNSVSIDMTRKGFYIAACTRAPIFVSGTRTKDGYEYSLNLTGIISISFWIQNEFILSTSILEFNNDLHLTSAQITELVHERSLYVSIGTLNQYLHPIFAEVNSFRNSPNSITLYDLVMDLFRNMSMNYLGLSHFPSINLFSRRRYKYLQDLVASIRSDFRVLSYNVVTLSVDDAYWHSIQQELVSIVEGSNINRITNVEEYIRVREVSLTDDLRILVSQHRIVIVEKFGRNPGGSIRSSLSDFFGFGILASEIISSLTLGHHEYLSQLLHTRRRGHLASTLFRVVSSMSVYSDPAFVQTPLLKRMVDKVISINGYETKIRDIRSNLSLLLNAIDQSLLRKITLMVFLSGFAVLFQLIDPQVFQSTLLKSLYLVVVIMLLAVVLVWPERRPLNHRKLMKGD